MYASIWDEHHSEYDAEVFRNLRSVLESGEARLDRPQPHVQISSYSRLSRNIEQHMRSQRPGLLEGLSLDAVHCPEPVVSTISYINVIPDFELQGPATSAMARMIKSSIQVYGHVPFCNADLLRQAITSTILQDMPDVLEVLLQAQRWLVYPMPRPSLTLSHVKLAAELCRVRILGILLDERVLLRVSRDDLLTMAEDLLIRKPAGWRAAYQLLVEDWRRKRRQRGGSYYGIDLWAKKLEIYSVQGLGLRS